MTERATETEAEPPSPKRQSRICAKSSKLNCPMKSPRTKRAGRKAKNRTTASSQKKPMNPPQAKVKTARKKARRLPQKKTATEKNPVMLSKNLLTEKPNSSHLAMTTLRMKLLKAVIPSKEKNRLKLRKSARMKHLTETSMPSKTPIRRWNLTNPTWNRCKTISSQLKLKLKFPKELKGNWLRNPAPNSHWTLKTSSM